MALRNGARPKVLTSLCAAAVWRTVKNKENIMAKRKVRKFAEGEFIDNDSESGEWAGDEDYGDGTTRAERVAMARAPGYKAKSSLTEDETSDYGPKGGRGAAGTSETESPAKRAFKDAFASARMGGDKTFEWNGKKYSTAMAGGKGEQASVRKVDNAIAAKGATGAGAGRGGQGGPTAAELESYAASKKAAPTKTGVDAIPTEGYRKVEGGEKIDSTELGRNVKNTLNALAPIGGGVGKVGAELATAGRTQRAYNAAQAERRAAEGMSPAEALAARASQAAPKAAKAEKSVPTKGREEVTNPLMWAAGPKNAGKFKEGAKQAPKKAKKALDESDTTGGAVGYKKGGNVRGWGIARGARKAKIV
jgi:hypothetical protein